MAKQSRQESDLYDPIRSYLEAQGYSVYAEVTNSDLVARKRETAVETEQSEGQSGSSSEELIVVELKTRLSLDLLIQAVRRKELTDSVYVAIPLEGSKARVRNAAGVRALLNRLELGMLAVRFLRSRIRVELIAHPRPFTPRTARRKRIATIREIDGRYAEFDLAGQPSRTERITAYKQQAILLADLLQRHGSASPAQLRALGGPARSGAILSANVYGWYERIRRGVYALSPAGHAALARYAYVVARIQGGS